MRTSPAAATVDRLAGQGHLIGTRWVASAASGVHEHRYAATGQVQAAVGLGGPDDVDAAVAAARAAQPAWAALGPEGRRAVLMTLARLLDEHREEAAELAALDYGAQGIRVNAICPGTARTPMVDEAIRRQPDIDAHLKALHPIGRIGEASEIAEAAVWLCTPAASFVLGVALPVDCLLYTSDAADE